MHDLISGFFSSLSSRLLLLILLSTALPGCANQVRVPSENFNTRVSLLVIHHTTENFAESLETLTKKSGYPVSSHYLIPEPDDPTYDQRKLRIYELVPETHRAWHAGDSYWGGRTSLNDQSIGIELVNRTHCHRSAVDTGDGIVEAAEAPGPGTIDESTAIAGAAPASICFYPDFAESQIDLLVNLLEDVLKRHPSIKPTQIVGHSDIAPDRKIDPGPRFPWQRLYRHGFGAWYDDDTVIRYWERFRLQPLPLRNVQRALGVYGYRIEANGKFDVQTRDVLRAFQMHFRPAQSYGSMTTETVATLFALIEKYYPEQLDDLLRVDNALGEPAQADTDAPCEVGVYRGPDGDFVTIVERDHTGESREWRYTFRNGEYGSTKEGVVRCVPGAIVVTRGGDAEERWPAAPLKLTPTRFESGDVTLAGLLIEPAVDGGSYPLVAIVHGSESTAAIRRNSYPYIFAAQGIAAFVYDKRGTGASEGVYHQNFHKLAADVVAASKEARRLAKGRYNRFGLFGGSQGGWVAPRAANGAGADFVAVGFGLLIDPLEEDAEQVFAELREAGYGDDVIAKAREVTDATGAVIAAHFESGYEQLAAVEKRYRSEPWFPKIKGEFTGDLLASDEAGLRRDGRADYDNLDIDWRYDAMGELRKVEAPQLWVVAGEDREAPPFVTIERLQALRDEGKDICIARFPDTDHGMVEFTASADGERTYTRITEGYFRLLGDWIKGVAGRDYGAAEFVSGRREPAGPC